MQFAMEELMGELKFLHTIKCKLAPTERVIDYIILDNCSCMLTSDNRLFTMTNWGLSDIIIENIEYFYTMQSDIEEKHYYDIIVADTADGIFVTGDFCLDLREYGKCQDHTELYSEPRRMPRLFMEVLGIIVPSPKIKSANSAI